MAFRAIYMEMRRADLVDSIKSTTQSFSISVLIMWLITYSSGTVIGYLFGKPSTGFSRFSPKIVQWDPYIIISFDLFTTKEFYTIPVTQIMFSVALACILNVIVVRQLSETKYVSWIWKYGSLLFWTFSSIFLYILIVPIFVPEINSEYIAKVDYNPSLFDKYGVLLIFAYTGFLILNSLSLILKSGNFNERQVFLSIGRLIPAVIVIHVILSQIMYLPFFGRLLVQRLLMSDYYYAETGREVFSGLLEILIIIFIIQLGLGLIASAYPHPRDGEKHEIGTKKMILAVPTYLIIVIGFVLFFIFQSLYFTSPQNQYAASVGGFANPFYIDLNSKALPPGADPSHPLGTDRLGRDIFSIVIFSFGFTVVLVTGLSLLVVGCTMLLRTLRVDLGDQLGGMIPRVLVLPLPWLAFSYLFETMVSQSNEQFAIAIIQLILSLVLYIGVYSISLNKREEKERFSNVIIFLSVFPSMLLDSLIMDFFGFGMTMSIGGFLGSYYVTFDSHPSFGIIYPVIFLVIVLTYMGSFIDQIRTGDRVNENLYPVEAPPENVE